MPEYDFLKDEDLVKKSLEGEDNAFRELVDRYQSPLVNYLYRFTGIRELSEEIVQETFIAVFQNIENFHLEASFRAWIYAIATNRALNMLRRKSPTCNPIALENAVGNRDPIQEVSEQERSIAVQKALGSLPEKQRAIFILRFYQGLSYEEIALAMGCPIGTIKSRICYTLKKLRGLLWPHRE